MTAGARNLNLLDLVVILNAIERQTGHDGR
jgi:hypothetical protein